MLRNCFMNQAGIQYNYSISGLFTSYTQISSVVDLASSFIFFQSFSFGCIGGFAFRRVLIFFIKKGEMLMHIL